MNRESTEWSQFYWFASDNKVLPRVLLIGDSIVSGHRNAVAARLEGKATVAAFSTSRIIGDPAMYRELAIAFADYPIDMVYFNNGLHGFTYDDDYYRKNLSDFVDFLRMTTKARIFWRSSTPMMEKEDLTQFNRTRGPVIKRRNQIANEIMQAKGIPTDDLYSVMVGHPEYYCPDATHCSEAGVEAQADHVAAFISKALDSRKFEYKMNGFTTDFPGVISDWNGYERCDFYINGIKSILVKPNKPVNASKDWFWRVHFFGAFPNADFPMLELGWHVAHIDVHELYGSPECSRRMDLLYQFLTAMGFNKKCVPVGYSRGGLDVYNWSAENTDKVSCLYLDNPVCDFKSWPGGRGEGPGSEEGWSNCLKSWGFSEEQALAYDKNPIDNLEPLAKAQVPILHVYGDADEVVPIAENTTIVAERYSKLGGTIELINKSGGKHHPHCLENPQPIVDFIIKNHK